MKQSHCKAQVTARLTHGLSEPCLDRQLNITNNGVDCADQDSAAIGCRPPIYRSCWSMCWRVSTRGRSEAQAGPV